MKMFRRKVQRGTRLGRKLGFPTINLSIGRFDDHFRQGVYICEVQTGLHPNPLAGLLYFGPKPNHKSPVLEIYLHRFKNNLYGKWVRFSVGQYLRRAQQFSSLAALKKQMRQDLLRLNHETSTSVFLYDSIK